MRAAVAIFGLSLACQASTGSSSPVTPTAASDGGSAAACPTCECQCNCEEQSREAQDLIRAATRKIAHRDRACLDDLNRLRQIDPRGEAYLGYLRGQCEMVSGHCQAGKARIHKLMSEEQAMGPDMADRVVDGYAGMYCQGGDAGDRDQLLAALQQLTDGAYMNRRDPEFCRARVDAVRKLLPRVKPRGPDDYPIANAPDSLYVMGAKCLERAGDCRSARKVFEDLLPGQRLSSVAPAQRRGVVQTMFDATVEGCKGTR